MRFYKVRVRRWFTEDEMPRKKKASGKVFRDEICLVQALSIDEAQIIGFEAALGRKFFGVPQSQCQVMETATIEMPYFI